MSKDKNKSKDDESTKLSPEDKLSQLEREILDEAIRITKNETTSCYVMVQKTKELLKIKSVLS